MLFSFYLREEKKHIKVERDLSKRKKKICQTDPPKPRHLACFWVFSPFNYKRVFGCVVASAFEATTATPPFGNAPTTDFYWWGLPLIVARPQVCKKQQFAAS